MRLLVAVYFGPGLVLFLLYILPAALGLLYGLPRLLVMALWFGWFLVPLLGFVGLFNRLPQKPALWLGGFVPLAAIFLFVASIPGKVAAVDLYAGLIEEALASPPAPLDALPSSARSMQVTDLEVARIVSQFELCSSDADGSID